MQKALELKLAVIDVVVTQEIVKRDGEQQPYRQMQNPNDGTEWRCRINLPLNYTKESVTRDINKILEESVRSQVFHAVQSIKNFTSIR
jgi:hypothetical protein